MTVSLSNEILFLAILVLSFISVRHPVQEPLWPSNFAPGIKMKFKNFSGELQKGIFIAVIWISTRELSKNHIQIMQRFYKICCYFSQNPQRKGSISPSSFYGQLSNIWFTCLCLKVLRVAAMPYFQSKGSVLLPGLMGL